jgi:nicotinamidase-related amidase
MRGNHSTRHKSSVALILIDVINHFEFPDGDKILKNALPMAARLAKLKDRCRCAGIPAIYVNYNFGQWRSDAKSLVSHCLESHCAGRPFVEPIRPDEEDYFVLKPMHSLVSDPARDPAALFGSYFPDPDGTRDEQLHRLDGWTAHEAKMRNFSLYVPSDCSAARTGREHEHAIEHIQEMTCASVVASPSLRVGDLRGESRRRKKPKA